MLTFLSNAWGPQAVLFCRWINTIWLILQFHLYRTHTAQHSVEDMMSLLYSHTLCVVHTYFTHSTVVSSSLYREHHTTIHTHTHGNSHTYSQTLANNGVSTHIIDSWRTHLQRYISMKIYISYVYRRMQSIAGSSTNNTTPLNVPLHGHIASCTKCLYDYN